ncbi:unnamed protein product [Penicillium roqueforti FM164]|uniref:Uncharacterized protein n=1 Tax=Penicillium roqueforti (strain FM164) TaxID=1365484 RepID=W6QMT7_PENRF|nr:unnamed protein product [Penicillium roqueforti FM164]
MGRRIFLGQDPLKNSTSAFFVPISESILLGIRSIRTISDGQLDLFSPEERNHPHA